jgi:hypothetical protein
LSTLASTHFKDVQMDAEQSQHSENSEQSGQRMMVRRQSGGWAQVKPHFSSVGRWDAALALVGLCALVGSTAVLLPRASAWAGEGETHTQSLKRRAEEWGKQEQLEADRKFEWQKRLEERRYAVEKARSEVIEANTSRLRASDGGYAGVSRSEWTRRWRRAQAKLEAAEKALEALPEEARRAGVPPGWLRETPRSKPAAVSSPPD